MTSKAPYAEMIGARRADGAEPILTVNWRAEMEGRPGFFHGGVIAGLLEMACYQALHEALSQEFPDIALPGFKPINVSVDYLRGGVMTDMHALAQIVRIGKRVANAAASCWQDDRNMPIATGRMHFLIDR
ncbi:thioesterase [Sphingomonas sp. Root710]|uniref:PaaI family thioesterase n=1 Tax=Sphingomonas sp. Root710 TaxID=1736594 RepID=UPI0006FF706F|nr:PaaI family thioesterase [Sphingomonas sp. Root710]KRB86834.1 thioesterase [Sphingomonas sp. Root710]